MANNDKEMQKLPFGSEFSPSQVELPNLLNICKQHEGDKDGIEKAIIETFFSDKVNFVKKLGSNCRLGMQCYGILDSQCKFTDTGALLYEHRNDSQLYVIFARHILLHLNGLLFLTCLQDLQKAEKKITLTTMKKGLEARGLTYPKGGKHPSIMRLWLDKVGLVNKQWEVNSDVLNQILGSEDKTSVLSELDNLQIAFLKTLINSGIKAPQPASDIVKLAQNVYGLEFPEKSLPKLVLNKLADSNLIVIQKSTKGRGAKPFLVQLHPDANPEIILPTLAQLKKRLSKKLLDLISKPMSEILDEMKSRDTYISGLALEALAFKLMQILDMDHIATRLRAEQTGGAEVDLLFESSRLVYSRWQIQCKNTKTVSLDPVAKEVGLTHMLKSNVIMVVTSGTFTSSAKEYANTVMRDSNLNVILVDGSDLDKISKSPAAIVDILNSKAKHAMEIKKLNINA